MIDAATGTSPQSAGRAAVCTARFQRPALERGAYAILQDSLPEVNSVFLPSSGKPSLDSGRHGGDKLPLSTGQRYALVAVALLLIVATAVMLGAGGLPSSGLLSLLQAQPIQAFDSTLLAREPLAMGDIRITAGMAATAVQQEDWHLALRLVRDGRNQWQDYLPALSATEAGYRWTAADLRRASTLWHRVVQEVTYKHKNGSLRTLAQLEALMNRYRYRGLVAS
jgi:hypothetical protein